MICCKWLFQMGGDIGQRGFVCQIWTHFGFDSCFTEIFPTKDQQAKPNQIYNKTQNESWVLKQGRNKSNLSQKLRWGITNHAKAITRLSDQNDKYFSWKLEMKHYKIWTKYIMKKKACRLWAQQYVALYVRISAMLCLWFHYISRIIFINKIMWHYININMLF